MKVGMKIIMAGLISAFLLTTNGYAVHTDAAPATAMSKKKLRGSGEYRDSASPETNDYHHIKLKVIAGVVLYPSKQKGETDPTKFTPIQITAANQSNVSGYIDTLLSVRAQLKTCANGRLETDANKKFIAFMDKVISDLKTKLTGLSDNTCGATSTADRSTKQSKCSVDVAAQMFLTARIEDYLKKSSAKPEDITKLKLGHETLAHSVYSLDVPADVTWSENALYKNDSAPMKAQAEDLEKLKTLNVTDKCVAWGTPATPTPTPSTRPGPSVTPGGPSATPTATPTAGPSGSPIPISTLPLGIGEKVTPTPTPGGTNGGTNGGGNDSGGGAGVNAGGVGDNAVGGLNDNANNNFDPNDFLNRLKDFANIANPPVFEAPRTNDADRSAQGGDRTESPQQPQQQFPPQLADQGGDDDDNEEPFVPGDEERRPGNDLSALYAMLAQQNQNNNRQPIPEPVAQGPQFDPRAFMAFANRDRDRDDSTATAQANAFAAILGQRLNQALGTPGTQTAPPRNQFGQTVSAMSRNRGRGRARGPSLTSASRGRRNPSVSGINSAAASRAGGSRKPLGSGL